MFAVFCCFCLVLFVLAFSFIFAVVRVVLFVLCWFFFLDVCFCLLSLLMHLLCVVCFLLLASGPGRIIYFLSGVPRLLASPGHRRERGSGVPEHRRERRSRVPHASRSPGKSPGIAVGAEERAGCKQPYSHRLQGRLEAPAGIFQFRNPVAARRSSTRRAQRGGRRGGGDFAGAESGVTLLRQERRPPLPLQIR